MTEETVVRMHSGHARTGIGGSSIESRGVLEKNGSALLVKISHGPRRPTLPLLALPPISTNWHISAGFLLLLDQVASRRPATLCFSLLCFPPPTANWHRHSRISQFPQNKRQTTGNPLTIPEN